MHLYCPFPGRLPPPTGPQYPPIKTHLNKKPGPTRDSYPIQEVTLLKRNLPSYGTELEEIINTLRSIVTSALPIRHSFKTLEHSILAFAKRDHLHFEKMKNRFAQFLEETKSYSTEPTPEELKRLSHSLKPYLRNPSFDKENPYISRCLSAYFDSVRSITTCMTGPCVSPIDERIVYLNALFEELTPHSNEIAPELIDCIQKIQALLSPFLLSLDRNQIKKYDDLSLWASKQLYLLDLPGED